LDSEEGEREVIGKRQAIALSREHDSHKVGRLFTVGLRLAKIPANFTCWHMRKDVPPEEVWHRAMLTSTRTHDPFQSVWPFYEMDRWPPSARLVGANRMKGRLRELRNAIRWWEDELTGDQRGEYLNGDLWEGPITERQALLLSFYRGRP
jgi:hypothetical protein